MSRRASWFQKSEENVLSMENVVKAGCLEKRGHFRTNWQMRKFTLDDRNIKYFDENDKMKGSLDLLGAKIVDIGGANYFDFDIITSVPAIMLSKEKSYTLNLRASSYKEKEEWINMLRIVTSSIEVDISTSFHTGRISPLGYPSDSLLESFKSHDYDQTQSPKSNSITNNIEQQSKEESNSLLSLNNVSQNKATISAVNESTISAVNNEVDLVQNNLSDNEVKTESAISNSPFNQKDQSVSINNTLVDETETVITTVKVEESEIIPSTITTQESANITVSSPSLTSQSSNTVTNESISPQSLEFKEDVVNTDNVTTETKVESSHSIQKSTRIRSARVQIINKVNSDSDSGEEFVQDVLYSKIPSNLDEMIVKEGNLQKEGHIYKSWKIRKFVLSGKSLKYFDEKNVLKGAIDLEGCKIFDCKLDDEDRTKTNIDYDFEILSDPTIKNDKKISTDKNYIRLRALTDFEKQDWIHTIKQVLSSLQEGVKVEKVLTQKEKRILMEKSEKDKLVKEKLKEKEKIENLESLPILDQLKKIDPINVIKDTINKEIEENKSNFFDVITTLTKDVAPKTWMTVLFTLFALLVMNKWLSLLCTFFILYLVQTGKI